MKTEIEVKIMTFAEMVLWLDENGAHPYHGHCTLYRDIVDMAENRGYKFDEDTRTFTNTK